MVHHNNETLNSKKEESNNGDEAVCLRPQRKGFPTGGWVERGRRYTAEGTLIWLTRHSFLQSIDSKKGGNQ